VFEDLLACRALVWGAAGQHLVEGGPEQVDVCPWPYVPAPVGIGLLWCHVGRRTRQLSAPGRPPPRLRFRTWRLVAPRHVERFRAALKVLNRTGVIERRPWKYLGQPPVDDVRRVEFAQLDVPRLQIAVDDALPVGVRHRIANGNVGA